MKSGAKLVRYGLLISLPALWFIYLIAQSPRGVDFFPLYFAAQRVLAGHSPYGAAATDALQQQWQAPFAHAGVAYPLPLILLIIPFSLLAFPLAAWLWTLLGAALTYLCVGIPRPDAAAWFVRHEQQWMLVLLPLAFMPFHRSVVVSQATLVWFGLAVVMLWAISRRQPWLVAGCIVLLALKPQNGLLVALYGAVWLFRTRARWLGLAAALGAALLGASWLTQPHWLAAWLDQVRIYQAAVQPASLLPWGLLVLLACWRLPAWALVAVAQVVLFPLSDVYSGLPLLLAWCALSPPVALVGTSLSWLWVLLGLPNTTPIFWAVILLPLMAAGAHCSTCSSQTLRKWWP